VEVVRQYVSFARSGEFAKLGSVTVSPPSESTKSTSAPANNGVAANRAGPILTTNNDLLVVPDDQVDANARLEWVTGDFARSIHDGKLAVNTVKSESASDTHARVEIILGNGTTTNLLGWIFLLRKVDDNWKIYDITTAGEDVSLPR
jgi:hypothetical protein